MKNRFGFDESKVAGAPYWSKPQLGRRLFFRHVGSAVGGYMLMPGAPMETVARAAVTTKNTAKNVIFFMLQGAPSHTDTFDLKPANGMPVAQFKPTEYNGLLFPQGLMPKLAGQIDSLALVRSVRAWANVHGLMQTWVQLGRNPATPLAKLSPHIGSVVSVELAKKGSVLPTFIALNGTPRVASGFLPVANAPFMLTAGAGFPNTKHPDGSDRFASRMSLLRDAETAGAPGASLGDSPDEIADWKLRSQMLMYNSSVDQIFNLNASERAQYGTSALGDACLTARNILKANMGTRFIQITYGGWDHHNNLYARLTPMATEFDNGLSRLITDLKTEGLFDETLIVAQGEFGRTPGLNGAGGRDHFAQQTALFAGARIRGGRAIGATDPLGATIVEPGWSRDREVRAEDIEATIYSALGIDWTTLRRDSRFGRGFEYVPESSQDRYGPVHELWG
ncbi:MAG: DUF1501 domain-containing protein [Candidatus Solibacter usitatus]|nr:DUF1501 domain-containing protein [Candidatus Solibacter usitatus]